MLEFNENGRYRKISFQRERKKKGVCKSSKFNANDWKTVLSHRKEGKVETNKNIYSNSLIKTLGKSSSGKKTV